MAMGTAAARALAKLAEFASEGRKDEIVDHLVALLDDPWFRSQDAAIAALEELKATKALPHLERTAPRAPDGRPARAAPPGARPVGGGARGRRGPPPPAPRGRRGA